MTTNKSNLSDEDRTLVFAFLNQELAVREALRNYDKAAEPVSTPQLIRLADIVHWENYRLKVLFQRIIERKISSEEIQKLRRELAKRRFMKFGADYPRKALTEGKIESHPLYKKANR